MMSFPSYSTVDLCDECPDPGSCAAEGGCLRDYEYLDIESLFDDPDEVMADIEAWERGGLSESR